MPYSVNSTLEAVFGNLGQNLINLISEALQHDNIKHSPPKDMENPEIWKIKPDTSARCIAWHCNALQNVATYRVLLRGKIK